MQKMTRRVRKNKDYDPNSRVEVGRRKVQNELLGDHSETLKSQAEFRENARRMTSEWADQVASDDIADESLQGEALGIRELMEDPAYRGICPGGTMSAKSIGLRKEVSRRMANLFPGEVEIDRVPSTGKSIRGIDLDADLLTSEQFKQVGDEEV